MTELSTAAFVSVFVSVRRVASGALCIVLIVLYCGCCSRRLRVFLPRFSGSRRRRRSLDMPTVNVTRDLLFQRLGQTFSECLSILVPRLLLSRRPTMQHRQLMTSLLSSASPLASNLTKW